MLSVPDGVDVRKVDLSIELQILAFHEQRKAGEEAAADVTAAQAVGTAQTAVAAGREGSATDQGPDGDVPAVMPA
ncbi:hypothetical protein GCM10019016_092880 [Streptomyces prasinosporus]|uniref:Uncharacterized protein n=1 Tax=Streptomyces prasinosporus TaxID=68256 RepID=A0ABP6U3E3_9ACTN